MKPICSSYCGKNRCTRCMSLTPGVHSCEAMRQAAMLAWSFAECRMGQIPAPLRRNINDSNHAPQLAAGYLTYILAGSFSFLLPEIPGKGEG